LIPWYGWTILTLLLLLAWKVNDDNLPCFFMAFVSISMTSAIILDLQIPDWAEAWTFVASVLLCLLFVVPPPTTTPIEEDEIDHY
jgi:hypothetical protein